jgi:sec-independent protein translocase protein TatC
MSVVEHIDEFRYRILISLAAFMVGMIVSFIFYRPILELMMRPLDEANRLGDVEVKDVFVPGVTGPFMLRLRVSAFAGLLFALPVLLFQLWRFITPGLHSNEKRYAIPFVGSSLGLFALGAWFAFLVLPTGVRFLLSFVEPGLQQPFITFQDYLSFIIFMILAFGITFEFPILLVFLSLVGIVTSRRLRKWRRYALLGVFVVVAVATPSQDPFSQIAMAAPLYILYEASILVIRFALKR